MRTYPIDGEPYSEGWARVTSNPARSVAPTATVSQVGSGASKFEVAVPLSDGFENNVFLPYLNNGPYTTLIGVANASGSAETATVIARSGSDGSELCRTSVAVNSLESGGGLLTDLLSCTAGGTGSLQITTDGPGLATISLWVTSDGTITPVAPIKAAN